MKYSTVTNLKFIDKEQKHIGCTVNFVGLGEIPFTASSEDTTKHGIEIYNRAINGEFGSIEQYASPATVELSDEQLANDIRLERKYKLVELDYLVMNPMRWASFTDEQKNSLQEYRQALLDITDQPTFPKSVVWPERPELLPPPVEISLSDIVLS